MADTGIELIKDTASSAVKASADIASGTVEQITGVPNSQGAQQGDKSIEQGKSANDPNAVAQRKAAEKRRFDEVKGELEQYVQRKRQQDVRIAQEKAQTQQDEKRKEEEVKQRRDSWADRLLKKVGAGAHGETDKQKE